MHQITNFFSVNNAFSEYFPINSIPGYITKQLGHAESDLKFTDVEPFWSKMIFGYSLSTS
jgi:hypothetical protein